MRIHNIIDSVDGYKNRDISSICSIAVHRTGIDKVWGHEIGFSGPEIVRAFTGLEPKWHEVAKTTGFKQPYSFMIGGDCGPAKYDGIIWQALPLDVAGPHARFASSKTLGIGCIGDFRTKHASKKQYAALFWLVCKLCQYLEIDPEFEILGHGEIAGSHDGSKAPGQPNACPGDMLDMKRLRADVSNHIRRQCSSDGMICLLEAGAALDFVR